MIIGADETEIRGGFMSVRGEIVEDDSCRRIAELIDGYLEMVGHDESGWDTLYRDPTDGRYWELTYPESEMHGGGPPLLRNIGPADLREKYGIVEEP